MRNFLLGLIAGAVGTYAAIKLSDEETRRNLCDKAQGLADKAREELDYGLTIGKSKALRAGVMARNEARKGKQKVNEVTGDVAGKLSESLAEISEKAKTNAANS